jgi:hypothetical protein
MAMNALEQLIVDNYNRAQYPDDAPETVGGITGAEPEAVPGAGEGPGPLSAEAATAFGKDVARFGKGAVTAGFGAAGDVIALGRGLYEIGRRGGDESIVDAFSRGIESKTILPTTEDVNKWIDENLPVPEFMKGKAGAAQTIGEFATFGGMVKKAAPRVIQATENIPVGMQVKPVTEAEAAQMLAAKGVQQTAKQQAPKSDIGFYSAVEDAALNLQRNSGAGQAFLNDIKKGANVKDEEIKWLGLDDFLRGKKNVTKQEVQDYIANNRVDVQEVALGGGADVREKADIDYSEGRLTRDEYNQILASSGAPSKFGSYTLPGGENYREILLTMPPKQLKFDVWLESMGKKYGGDTPRSQWSAEDNADFERLLKADKSEERPYRSSHFDQPNILAHIRVNDRVDADGKKMLLIEEVQSDWHQAGRDKGYRTPETMAAQQKQLDDIVNERQRLLDEQKRLEDLAKPYTDQGKDAPSNIVEQWSIVSNRINDLQRQQSRLRNYFKTTGVPDAPMKDTWYQLALKRALQYAAENGYDRVGLTTGARQAERYDLSKQIKTIVYGKPDENGKRMVEAITPSGDRLLGKKYSPEEIQNNIGKEMADKIKNSTGEFDERTGTYALSGLDLQVGGEGMKKYYDEVYPKFLQKYGKKWDAKMGNTTIEADGAEPVRYIDITPKMKQSVSDSGQPLFTAAPIATGAGSATISQDGGTDGN